MMETLELKKRLKEFDDQIGEAAQKLEDAQLDLEVLYKKRTNFARRNCPHTATYNRSIMGREIETRCKLCEIEL
jgi:hypothetical protein